MDAAIVRDAEARKMHAKQTLDHDWMTPQDTANILLTSYIKRSDEEIAEAAKHSFSKEDEFPAPVMAWADLENPLKATGLSHLYTVARPGENGAMEDDPGTWDVQKALNTFLHSKVADADGKVVYRITGVLGRGGYGFVYSAVRTMAHPPPDYKQQEVAIKFENLIGPDSMVEIMDQRTKQKDPAMSIRSSIDWFVQYALQRMYGGCLMSMVCLYDVFFLATRNEKDPSNVTWYKCSVMEKMDGDLTSLVKGYMRSSAQNIKQREDLRDRKKFLSRMLFYIDIVTQMSKCLYELQLNRFYHNDIKMANFLYSRDPRSGRITVKLADFGIAKFSSYYTMQRAIDKEIPRDRQNAQWTVINKTSRIKYLDLDEKSDMLAILTGGYVNATMGWPMADIMDFGRMHAVTTVTNKPPEYYLIVKADPKDPERIPPMDVPPEEYNPRWMDRMMGYQFVTVMRELAFALGLNRGIDPRTYYMAAPADGSVVANYIKAVVYKTENGVTKIGKEFVPLVSYAKDRTKGLRARNLSALAKPVYDTDKSISEFVVSCVNPMNDLPPELKSSREYVKMWEDRILYTILPAAKRRDPMPEDFEHAMDEINQLIFDVLTPMGTSKPEAPDYKMDPRSKLCIGVTRTPHHIGQKDDGDIDPDVLAASGLDNVVKLVSGASVNPEVLVPGLDIKTKVMQATRPTVGSILKKLTNIRLLPAISKRLAPAGFVLDKAYYSEPDPDGLFETKFTGLKGGVPMSLKEEADIHEAATASN